MAARRQRWPVTPSAPGRYAWRFREPQLLDKPVPMTGRLGIFELPDRLVYVDRREVS
jgi:hypothetical protein